MRRFLVDRANNENVNVVHTVHYCLVNIFSTLLLCYVSFF
jgi:hypothetical protein